MPAHPLRQKMQLQTILFGQYEPPLVPVTRSHRIMNQVTYIKCEPKQSQRQIRKESPYKDDRLLKSIGKEWKPASELAAKAGLSLNAFYQRIRKFREFDLIETRRVSGKGSVRYRYYRLRQK